MSLGRRTALGLIVMLIVVTGVWLLVRPTSHSALGQARPDAVAGALAAPDEPPVLLAAGDIATCRGAENETGALLAGLPGVVVPLGDLAYESGSPAQFSDCYNPAWGALAARSRPAMGNHDARTVDAAGYHGYFADGQAGPNPQGYYSYELGAWHVISLNTNCDLVGGCGPDSPMLAWLRDDLAAASTGNIVAYAHHPRFSTGYHGDDTGIATIWETLVDGGVDVYMSGHDHDYERFVPLDRDGTPSDTGMTAFVVGTGGTDLRGFGDARDTSAFRQADTHGILRLDLDDCGYGWSFLPVGGGTPLDAGRVTGTC